MLIYLVYLTYCKICGRLQGYKDTDLASLSEETYYWLYIPALAAEELYNLLTLIVLPVGNCLEMNKEHICHQAKNAFILEKFITYSI